MNKQHLFLGGLSIYLIATLLIMPWMQGARHSNQVTQPEPNTSTAQQDTHSARVNFNVPNMISHAGQSSDLALHETLPRTLVDTNLDGSDIEAEALLIQYLSTMEDDMLNLSEAVSEGIGIGNLEVTDNILKQQAGDYIPEASTSQTERVDTTPPNYFIEQAEILLIQAQADMTTFPQAIQQAESMSAAPINLEQQDITSGMTISDITAANAPHNTELTDIDLFHHDEAVLLETQSIAQQFSEREPHDIF